jgi:hypothetical protein
LILQGSQFDTQYINIVEKNMEFIFVQTLETGRKVSFGKILCCFTAGENKF